MSEIIKKPAQWEDCDDDYDSEEGDTEIGLTPTTSKHEEQKQTNPPNNGPAAQVVTN